MQALTRRDAGDFNRATADVGIGEQRLTERASSQLGQASPPAAQSTRRDQGPGEHPGLVIAQQLHLAGPGPGIQPHPQDARLVVVGAGPTLMQHANPKPARADPTQALSQRPAVEQPVGYFRGQVAPGLLRAGMPAQPGGE